MGTRRRLLLTVSLAFATLSACVWGAYPNPGNDDNGNDSGCTGNPCCSSGQVNVNGNCVDCPSGMTQGNQCVTSCSSFYGDTCQSCFEGVCGTQLTNFNNTCSSCS